MRWMEALHRASLWSRALAGAKAIPVAIEGLLRNGLPQFQIIGSSLHLDQRHCPPRMTPYVSAEYDA